MGSGGARTRSGPAPSNDSSDWTHIKNTPCELPVPSFPLPDPTDRELFVWNEVWQLPQARMWHKNNQNYEVALYVRRFTESEERGSSTALGTLVRQMADSLGLTVPGMKHNRWMLVDDVIQVEQERPKALPSARERFRALPGGRDDG